MNLREIKNKRYHVPTNVSKSTIKNYKYVIDSDYTKYLYAITLCGGGCMLRQFIELIEKMDEEPKITFAGYTKRARGIIDELEGIGFIETGYLNRNKYILLKHPSVALAIGDYNTYKRVSARSLFKTDKFTQSITKMQGLLDYNFIYKYSEMWDQLISITRQVYKVIIDNGNIRGYDLSLIEEIIEMGNYKEIATALRQMPEHKHRLGVVRFIWTEIGCLFRKLGQKSCLVSPNPLYLKIFSDKDGIISLHYVPVIVIYDSMKSLDFYNVQKTFLSNEFYEIKGNNSLGMKEEYSKTGSLGFEHFNRIGYTIMIIGANRNAIDKKKEIIDEPFNDGGIHTPMVKPSDSYVVDIDKYINHSNITSGSNVIFDKTVTNVETTVERLVSVVNGK